MKSTLRSVEINGVRHRLLLTVPTDASAHRNSQVEATLQLQNGNWVHAGFSSLALSGHNQKSDSPVKWDDSTVIQIRDFRIETILEAIRYIVSNGHLAKTFTNCPPPDQVLPDFPAAELDDQLRQKLRRSLQRQLEDVLIQIKSLGPASSRQELLRLLSDMAVEALNAIDVEMIDE